MKILVGIPQAITMEFLMKSQKIERIAEGSKIWAGLDTFYEGPDLSLTDYPMTPDQFALNLVEGHCVKKLKRSLEVQFPADICKNRVVFSHKDLCENRNTFVDEADLPKNGAVIKSGEDIDYIVGLAPVVNESSELEEMKATFLLREQQYKIELKKLWSENLACRLNEVEFVPVSILARNLPHFMGTPVESRTDVSFLTSSEKNFLESIREDLNLRFSVKTSLWDNLEMFDGVRVDLVESLANGLAGKKKDGTLDVSIDIPFIFATKILLPSLQLTGFFRLVNNVEQFQIGSSGKLLHRVVGKIHGLKLLGVLPSKHPKWKNPYVSVEFMTEEEADISPVLDSIRNKYDGQLPFVVNPQLLDASALAPALGRIRTELGDNYRYDCSPFKILHDISIGRMKAEIGDDRRNFCVRRWKFLSPENDQLVLDFVKPVEGSSTCRLHIVGSVLTAKFTSNEDVETGLVGEALRDL